MTSTIFSQRSSTQTQPWVDWTNLTLGIFLAVSPWLALGGDSAVMWNAVVCGATIATVACVALSKPSAGERSLRQAVFQHVKAEGEHQSMLIAERAQRLAERCLDCLQLVTTVEGGGREYAKVDAVGFKKADGRLGRSLRASNQMQA